MAVNLRAPDPATLLPVKGVRLGIAEAGIRKANRKDLMLMTLSKKTRVAGVFTRNRFCAAPVTIAKAHLQTGSIQALLVNTGCANAGTGEDGLARARQTCKEVASLIGCTPELFLIVRTVGQQTAVVDVLFHLVDGGDAVTSRELGQAPAFGEEHR